MDIEKKKKSTQSDQLSLGIVLIISGILLPLFFQSSTITTWITTILMGFGIGVIGVEADKSPNGEGLKSIGVGTQMFLIGFLSLFSFTYTTLRIIGFLIVIVGMNGVLSGLITNIKIRKNNKILPVVKGEYVEKTNLQLSWVTIFTIIGAIVGFIANIIAILEYLD